MTNPYDQPIGPTDVVIGAGEGAIRVSDISLGNHGIVKHGADPTGVRYSDVALQEAVDSGDGIISLGDGRFKLEHIVLINRSNLIIEGNGKSTVIFSDKTLTAAFRSGTEDISDITFRNISFEGGVIDEGIYPRRNRNFTPSFESAILMDGDLVPDEETNPVITNVQVLNCYFKNIHSLPVLLRGLHGYARMDDCDVYNCLDVGFIYNQAVFFNRNFVKYSADNGVSISRQNQNITCANNIIDGSAYCGIWLSGWQGGVGATGDGPHKFTCVGNIVTDSSWSGIHLADAPNYGIVEANIIDGVRKGPTDGPDDGKGMGIAVYPYPSTTYPVTDANITEYARELTIHNNTVRNAARGGIYIRGLLIGSITNNTIVNAGSRLKADGVTLVTATSLENWGILLDTQSGDTIQDITIESNKIYDNRTETMGDGTRITNYPIVMGLGLRIKCKDNRKNGTQQGLVDGMKQNSELSNNLESQIVAKASSSSGANTTAFVGADVDTFYRLGFLKKFGVNPYLALASGIAFIVNRLSTSSLLDPAATSEQLFKVDKDGGSNKAAIYLGTDPLDYIRVVDTGTDKGFRTEEKFTAAGGLKCQSAWNAGHFEMGGLHLWVDSSNRLRIKSSAPTSDTDGSVVGAQS